MWIEDSIVLGLFELQRCSLSSESDTNASG